MLTANRIKRLILAVAGGVALALGFAVAGLLGLAMGLVPAGLTILSLESQRARRWLGKARHVARKAHPLTKKELV